jgi:hypothetical protein
VDEIEAAPVDERVLIMIIQDNNEHFVGVGNRITVIRFTIGIIVYSRTSQDTNVYLDELGLGSNIQVLAGAIELPAGFVGEIERVDRILG